MTNSTPQVRIISLPTAGTISPPDTTDYIAIESVSQGGRKVDVNTFLSQAGAKLYAKNPATVTDRSIATFDGTTTVLRNNPNATIDSTGSITATGFYATSSERYKTNIVGLTGALELVKQLEGVGFEWIQPPFEGKQDIGLIAERVNEVVPTAVLKNGDGTCEAVEYSKLVPILINAVKELAAQVEELKNQINK